MFMLICLLGFVHFIHQEPEPDKELSATPTASTNLVIPPIASLPKTPPVDAFVKKNLFDPLRGKIPETPPLTTLEKPKKENLELVGTFKFGDKVGAIIKDTSPVKKDPSEEKNVKKVFYLNDTMPNGCMLKKIEKNLVILEQNGQEFELKIDLSDKGSKARTSTVAKIKETPTLISTGPPPGAATPAATKPGIPRPPEFTTVKPGEAVPPPLPPANQEGENLVEMGAPVPVNMSPQGSQQTPPQPQMSPARFRRYSPR